MQKLERYEKDHVYTFRSKLFETIFAEHPYRYPLLGHKHDVCNITTAKLMEFYHKHYKSNNAVLIVVGDVDADEVITLTEDHLADISSDAEYVKQNYFFNENMISRSLTLYRDIQEPLLIYAFAVPGLIKKEFIPLELLSMLIGGNKTSQLYNKLVIEQQLATDVSADIWGCIFDQGLFFITVHPKNREDLSSIKQIICAELHDLAKKGFTQEDFQKCLGEVKEKFNTIFEDPEKQAYSIAQGYLATRDKDYAFTLFDDSDDVLKQGVQNLLARYFYPEAMHKGYMLPLKE